MVRGKTFSRKWGIASQNVALFSFVVLHSVKLSRVEHFLPALLLDAIKAKLLPVVVVKPILIAATIAIKMLGASACAKGIARVAVNGTA
jgi:hypothetical protein